MMRRLNNNCFKSQLYCLSLIWASRRPLGFSCHDTAHYCPSCLTCTVMTVMMIPPLVSLYSNDALFSPSHFPRGPIYCISQKRRFAFTILAPPRQSRSTEPAHTANRKQKQQNGQRPKSNVKITKWALNKITRQSHLIYCAKDYPLSLTAQRDKKNKKKRARSILQQSPFCTIPHQTRDPDSQYKVSNQTFAQVIFFIFFFCFLFLFILILYFRDRDREKETAVTQKTSRDGKK